MKIQWNSDAAQEVLERLRRARRGLDDSVAKAHRIDLEVEEANAEGDDKVLDELAQSLSICHKELASLVQQLSDFHDAVNRSNDSFAEADRHNRSTVENLEVGKRSLPDGLNQGRSEWVSPAYTVMPKMRTQDFAIPGWLSKLTQDADIL